MATGGYIKHGDPDNCDDRVHFLNICKAYPPGEKVSILYQVSEDYHVSSNDCLILCKYPWKRASVFTPHRWAASTKRIDATYHVYITIPKEQNKNKEYQLLYINEDSKVEGHSKIIRIDAEEATEDESDARVASASSKAVGSLFGSKFWRSNEWLSGTNNSTLVKKKEEKSGGQELVVRPPKHVARYSPRMHDLYKSLTSVNRLMAEYQALHRKSEEECDKLLEEVTSTEKHLLRSQRFEEKMLEYKDLSPEMLESKRAEFLRERTILEEQCEGVKHEMMEKGYSVIVDLEDEEHKISTETGKMLDLRKWCVPKNRDSELEKTHRDNETNLRNLRRECDVLKDQMMQLKKQHRQCVNEMFRELADLHQAQCDEKDQDEKTIFYLENRIKYLTPDVDEENHLLLEYIQTLRKELEDKEALIETLRYESVHPNEIDLILATHVKHLEAELREKEEELLHCPPIRENSDSESGRSYPHTDSIQLTNTKAKSNRAQSMRSEKRAKKINTDDIKTKESGQQHTSSSVESRATSTTKSVASKPNDGVAAGTIPPSLRPTQLVYKSRSDAAASKEKESTDRQTHQATRASEQGFSCCASENQENWLKLLKLLLSKSTQLQIEAVDHAGPDSNLSPSDLNFVNHLFDSKTSIPVAPCNSSSSLDDCRLTTDRSTGSFEIATALHRMFTVSDEDLRSVLPGASSESIASLAEALRHLFHTASEKQAAGFSLSNESLAESLALLFREAVTGDASATSLSSTESMILWGLLEPEPEEQVGVDVKAINEEKAERSRAYQRKTNPCGGSVDKGNPMITGVIRSSSPDNDTDIEHPRKNSPKRSLIPRPIRTSNLRQSTQPQHLILAPRHQQDTEDSSENESSRSSSPTYSPVVSLPHGEAPRSHRDAAKIQAYRVSQNRAIRSKNARKYRRHSRRNH